LEQGFVLAAVDRALQRATPAIMNSDQGSHFTSPGYLDRLTTAQVQISMDGKGRALDNIFTERLWRTVKYEEVYLHSYASRARHGTASPAIFSSTTPSDPIKRWATRRQRRCTTGHGYDG
jgi:putative transposase